MYTQSCFVLKSLNMNNESVHHIQNFNQEVIMPYIGLALLLGNIGYYLYNVFL
ncbi:hypothetical protein [Acinetobacter sp. SFB]|uniref:hypothetical protein n=1 Tax=Acinetobacter sp. SFB TaxID=1805634 RepID=UPI000A4A05BD|nr:hypothetical protein [Acinetobacter sp. SFB]